MAGIQIDGVNNKIDFDDDLDTSISANTDDTLVIEAGGNTMATITSTAFTINDGTIITTADTSTTLTLKSTSAGASAGPRMVFERDSASPADSDQLGLIMYFADNDAGESTNFVEIKAFAEDVSDGTEDAQYTIDTMLAGSLRERVGFGPVATVFNDDSQDLDFRVESNGQTHMIFVDGGNDKVGIGTSAPVVPLSVRAAQEQLTLSEGDARGATFDYRSSTGNLNITTNGGNARSAPQLALHLNGVLSATAGVALGVGAANTASNVLDDYEEGTFAYTITGSTSGNLVLRSGYTRGSYVKIGNLVHVDIRFETTSDNSLSGNVYWSLPFTMANPNGSDADAAVAPGYIRDNAMGDDARTGTYHLSEGAAFVYYIFSREGAANSTTVVANNTNTDGVMEGVISISYRTT